MSSPSVPFVAIGPVALGPFEHDAVLAYVRAAGDDNPLHSDPSAAAAAGFADVLVPGMLLAAHVARCVYEAPPVAEILALTTRFARPVLPGQAMVLTGQTVARKQGKDPVAILRLKVTGPDGLAVMGEAEVHLRSV